MDFKIWGRELFIFAQASRLARVRRGTGYGWLNVKKGGHKFRRAYMGVYDVNEPCGHW